MVSAVLGPCSQFISSISLKALINMVRWFTRHHHLLQCFSFVQSLLWMVSNSDNRSLLTNCLASCSCLVPESTSKSNKTFSFPQTSSILLARALNMRTSVTFLHTSLQTLLTDFSSESCIPWSLSRKGIHPDTVEVLCIVHHQSQPR